MSSVVEIAAGEFDVGDEFIPNASPRHRRRLKQSIWIDARPVTWAHFEVFVSAGGYCRNELWIDDAGLPLPWERKQSVDSRCHAILAQAEPARRLFASQNRPIVEQPLTGVTWFEARAIARFYSARLPFEIEWEAAMRQAGASTDSRNSAKTSSVAGKCQSYCGLLQEWAGDAFSSKYWRSDFDRVGVSWSAATPETMVVVRGSSAEDMVQHVCCRCGGNPAESHTFRSFRRVWDEPPDANLVDAHWRSFEQV